MPNKSKRVLLHFSPNGTIACSDAKFAGQNWRRRTYLVPLPVCSARLHELARVLRSWWPLWFVFNANDSQYHGLVWATGNRLIQKELSL